MADYDLERKIHEKLIEIDKIKTGGKQAYGFLLGLFIGPALIIMYFMYPSIQSYTGMLLLFGIGFLIVGIGAIYDIRYGFPNRLAKAEDEYQKMIAQK